MKLKKKTQAKKKKKKKTQKQKTKTKTIHPTPHPQKYIENKKKPSQFHLFNIQAISHTSGMQNVIDCD